MGEWDMLREFWGRDEIPKDVSEPVLRELESFAGSRKAFERCMDSLHTLVEDEQDAIKFRIMNSAQFYWVNTLTHIMNVLLLTGHSYAADGRMRHRQSEAALCRPIPSGGIAPELKQEMVEQVLQKNGDGPIREAVLRVVSREYEPRVGHKVLSNTLGKWARRERKAREKNL